MKEVDAQIDPKDWYINTYRIPLAPITGPTLSFTSPTIYSCYEAMRRFGGTKHPPESLVAMVSVAIKRGGKFDHMPEDGEALPRLTVTNRQLDAPEQAVVPRLMLQQDEAVILHLRLELEYRDSTAKERRNPIPPGSEYQLITCGQRGVFSGLEELHRFCLSIQPRCKITTRSFVNSLQSLVSMAEHCAKGARARAKDEFKRERRHITSLKKLVGTAGVGRAEQVKRLLDETVNTPEEAFRFWVDLSLWWLNGVILIAHSWKAVNGGPIYAFYHRLMESYAYELVERGLIRRCRYCGSYFRHRHGKKYCSLKTDGRDCAKKARRRTFY